MKEKITKYRYDTRNDFKDKKLNYKELVMQAEKTYILLKTHSPFLFFTNNQYSMNYRKNNCCNNINKWNK